MWAIVPVKMLDEAKGRLDGKLLPRGRRDLSIAMLQDVLVALTGADGFEGVAMVTRDPVAAKLGEELGVKIVTERSDLGLNIALDDAVAALDGDSLSGFAIFPSDIPLLRSSDTVEIVAAVKGRNRMAIVSSRDGQGTNCLAVSPSVSIEFCYGPGSFSKHVERAQSAGLHIAELSIPAVAIDIDEPQDLDDLMAFEPGRHTAACVSSLGISVSSF